MRALASRSRLLPWSVLPLLVSCTSAPEPPAPIRVAALTGHEVLVSLSPDGRAVGLIDPLYDNHLGPLYVWQVDTDRFQLLGDVLSPRLWFDPRGDLAVVLGDCGWKFAAYSCQVSRIDLDTLEMTPLLDDVREDTVQVSPDHTQVLGVRSTSEEDGIVVTWKDTSGMEVLGADVRRTSVALSPSGREVVYTTRDGAIHLAGRELSLTARTPSELPLFRADERFVAIPHAQGLSVYDLMTSRLLPVSEEPLARPLAFAPGRDRLVFYVSDAEQEAMPMPQGAWLSLRVADLAVGTGYEIDSRADLGYYSRTDVGLDRLSSEITLSPDGRWLVYRTDEQLRLHDLEVRTTQDLMARPADCPYMSIPQPFVYGFSFDSTAVFYHASMERHIQIHPLAGERLDVPIAASRDPTRAWLSPSLRQFVVETAVDRDVEPEYPDRIVEVVQLATWERHRFRLRLKRGYPLHFLSPDGGVLAFLDDAGRDTLGPTGSLSFYDFTTQDLFGPYDAEADFPFDAQIGKNVHKQSVLPLDDRVVYMLHDHERSGLYYIPVRR